MAEVIILFKQTRDVADFLKWKAGHQDPPPLPVFVHEMKGKKEMSILEESYFQNNNRAH